MSEKFLNHIDGQWVEPDSGEFFENRSPANHSDLIGLFPDSGASDVDRAVRSAQEGFKLWSRVPAPERGRCLRSCERNGP